MKFQVQIFIVWIFEKKKKKKLQEKETPLILKSKNQNHNLGKRRRRTLSLGPQTTLSLLSQPWLCWLEPRAFLSSSAPRGPSPSTLPPLSTPPPPLLPPLMNALLPRPRRPQLASPRRRSSWSPRSTIWWIGPGAGPSGLWPSGSLVAPSRWCTPELPATIWTASESFSGPAQGSPIAWSSPVL